MGRPKHLLPFGSETMLQRVVRLLHDVVAPIVVVGAPDQRLPPLPEGVAIARDEREHLGPLAGLAAGLAAVGTGVGAVYVSGCDAPLLKPAFVRRVVHCLGTYDLAVPRQDGFYQPLSAVYRTRLEHQVNSLIAQGRMRPLSLVETCNANVLDAELLRDVDPDLDSLKNVNTPAEYDTALLKAGIRAALET